MVDFRFGDLSNEIAHTLKTILTDGIDEINDFINDKVKFKKTGRGGVVSEINLHPTVAREHETIPVEKPTIIVNWKDKQEAWLATRSMVDTYNFEVQCRIKVLKKDQTERIIRAFGSAVQAYMNADVNRLQHIILDENGENTGRSWFDSMATRVAFGYADQGASRVASVNWWCKVFTFFDQQLTT